MRQAPLPAPVLADVCPMEPCHPPGALSHKDMALPQAAPVCIIYWVFQLATGSGFPTVPPLDLFLSLSQQPELPAQHSQACLPAPGMFVYSGLDVLERAFKSRLGMPTSRACGSALAPLRWVKELPSPTRSAGRAGSPDFALCAHSRRMERGTQEVPHRKPLLGHGPLRGRFGEQEQWRQEDEPQRFSSGRCGKRIPVDTFWVIPSQLRCLSSAPQLTATAAGTAPLGPAACFPFSVWRFSWLS